MLLEEQEERKAADEAAESPSPLALSVRDTSC